MNVVHKIHVITKLLHVILAINVFNLRQHVLIVPEMNVVNLFVLQQFVVLDIIILHLDVILKDVGGLDVILTHVQ